MPYIECENRSRYDRHLNCLVEELDEVGWHPGHLNYIIYSLLKVKFMDKRSYTEGNKLLGVLSAVGLEFYRRLLGPYEDEAIELNGDV